MPRPKNKVDLLTQSQQNYQLLLAYIDQFTPKQQMEEFPPGTMNRNIRDVLGHLHHWHLMFLQWYEVGMQGKKPVMPAEGYTWRTVPALNQSIWEHYQTYSLPEIKSLLNQSYEAVQKCINNHSDEELFTKKHYTWTGSTSLGAYLVSASSSHYDWALKLVKKATKKGMQPSLPLNT